MHAYARAVVAGKIVAGHLVRAACQRHLDDLKRSDLVWKPQAAETWLNFFQSLHLDAGVPFRLMEHQAFKVGCLTGWHRPDGRRRYRVAYIEEGKGNGKTPLAAAFALGALCIDTQPSPEVYLAAAAKEQARICFKDVEKIVRATPFLGKHLEVLTNNIAYAARMGFIRPLSSEDRGHHGLRIHLAVLDEIHAHGSGAMVDVVEAGTKNNRNSLVLLITNSGSDRLGPCWAYHQRAVELLTRGTRDDELFAYVATLDPCKKHRAQGRVAPEIKCPHCDDWRDLDLLAKANPSLGGAFFDRDYLARRIALAQKMPSKLNNVLQLNCCLWTQNDTGWADMAAWDGPCHEPALQLEHFAGRRAVIAMDAANRVDVTSLVCIVEREEGQGTLDPATLPAAAREALAELAGKGNGTEVIDQDAEPSSPALSASGYAVFAWHFVPRGMVDNSSQANHDAYSTWAHEGRLVVTPGNVTDFAAIMERIRTLAALLRVQRFQCDPRELGYFMQQLQVQEWCGFEVVEVTQSPAMISQPMKQLEALIAAGLLRHDGDPVLRWMVANVVQKTTRSGGPLKYYYPTRTGPERKIDGAVSLIMALDGILRTAQPEPEPGMMMLG